MKTLDRYVIREILPPLFLSLLIFTFILCIPPFMEQLEALVSKGVPWGMAVRMLVMLIPQGLGLTIPMSLLVGLLVALGRMSGDREAVALLACGVSPYRLLRPVLALAAVAGAAHLYVMIWAIPDANQAFRQLAYDVVTQQVESDVRPQVFFENFPNLVLYARDIPQGGGGWKDVLVADTSKPDAPILSLARRGRLVMDRGKQTVTLILEDGYRYETRAAGGRDIDTYRFPGQLFVTLDPKAIFPASELVRGMNELRIWELRRQAQQKLANHFPAHQELLAIHQRFSFPFAAIVFAVIGIALGLSVARDGKLAGFVVGIAVIFGYYILLYLAEAIAKGYYAGPTGASKPLFVAQIARWVPNLILLPFGILALVWRARWAEGRLPFRSAVRLTNAINTWVNRRRESGTAGSSPTPGAAAPGAMRPPRRRGVVLVVRVPRLSWMMPNILDRYIGRMYLRTVALSFAALLGLFYIGTFIDKTDKLFKGQATTGMVMQLLGFMTPQFVYFVIPLSVLLGVLVTFGLLSRSTELSVMKACGISLYRIAAPLVLLSMVWGGVLFALEQQLLAKSNQRAEALDAQIRGRAPRTSNPLNRRWLIGRDGGIYHYTYYDSQRNTLQNLTVYRPAAAEWRLDSALFTPEARYGDGEWIARDGWQQRFGGGGTWAAFAERALPLETPDYFESNQPIAELMTVPQLKHYIDELSASGFNAVPLTVELQKKIAFPFVTLVMTLLAVPFGVTTGKRGTLYGIGIGIVLALSYWIAVSAFAAIGKAGILHPILAGWAPNILASGTAVYLLLTTRT